MHHFSSLDHSEFMKVPTFHCLSFWLYFTTVLLGCFITIPTTYAFLPNMIWHTANSESFPNCYAIVHAFEILLDCVSRFFVRFEFRVCFLLRNVIWEGRAECWVVISQNVKKYPSYFDGNPRNPLFFLWVFMCLSKKVIETLLSFLSHFFLCYWL